MASAVVSPSSSTSSSSMSASPPLSPTFGSRSALSVDALDGVSKRALNAVSPRKVPPTDNFSFANNNGTTAAEATAGNETNGGTILAALTNAAPLGPLGHRPSLVRLSSGKTPKLSALSSPHSVQSASATVTQPTPSSSPSSLDELKPIQTSAAFESTFKEILSQKEMLAQQRQRIRQKVIRTSSQSNLPIIDTIDVDRREKERESNHKEKLRKMNSELLLQSSSILMKNGNAEVEDAVDEALDARAGRGPSRPTFHRTFTEPSHSTREKYVKPDQPLTLAYTPEAPLVQREEAEHVASALTQQEQEAALVANSHSFEFRMWEDEDDEKGDRESASLPSPSLQTANAQQHAALAARAQAAIAVANSVPPPSQDAIPFLEIRLPAAASEDTAIPPHLPPFARSSSTPTPNSVSSRPSSRLNVMHLPQHSSKSPSPAGSRQGSRASSRQGSRQSSPERGKPVARQVSFPQGKDAHSVGGIEANFPTRPAFLSHTSLSTTSSANLTPTSMSEGRYAANFYSEAPTPRRKRVIFREELVDHQKEELQSRSITPTPSSHIRRQAAKHANGKLRSVLKRPSTAVVAQSLSAVVKQLLHHHPQTVHMPFSLHAPYASPAGLLKLQVALFHDAENLNSYCTTLTRTGNILIKYNQSGKPMQRWFYVSEADDDIRLCWAPPKTSKTKPLWQVNPNGLGFTPADDTLGEDGKPLHKKTKSTSSSLLPAFSIGKWKFNQDRSRSLLEVTGIHYGPYYSANFCRFLDQLDSASGKPWLCFSVQFKDRTVDLVGSNEHEVTAWFLGLQAQAPHTCFHMTRGMILWQRTIMKLNYYGIEQIKRVFAKRASMAQTNEPSTH